MSDETKREKAEASTSKPAKGERAYRVGDGPLYLGARCVLEAGAIVRRQDLEAIGAAVLEALVAQGRAVETD